MKHSCVYIMRNIRRPVAVVESYQLPCMFELDSMMRDRLVKVTAWSHGQTGTWGSGMRVECCWPLEIQEKKKNCGHLQSHLRHVESTPYTTATLTSQPTPGRTRETQKRWIQKDLNMQDRWGKHQWEMFQVKSSIVYLEKKINKT